jgi:hypothetical protein
LTDCNHPRMDCTPGTACGLAVVLIHDCWAKVPEFSIGYDHVSTLVRTDG